MFFSKHVDLNRTVQSLKEFLFVQYQTLFHSHSIVPGGLLVISYTTQFIPLTSLIIRFDIFANTSGGNSNQSAVIPSVNVTERNAQTFSMDI